jgi:hypothetical protein
LEVLSKPTRHYQTLDKRKSFVAFNQSATTEVAVEEHHIGNFMLTTTLTIKGAVVWDNKFILAWLK